MAFIAPAGTRLTLGDIVAGLGAGWIRRGSELALHSALCQLGGSAGAWSVVSGRAAMTIALRAVAQLAGTRRPRVIIPAYTCYSVPAAVERAGLVPVPCDIETDTLSLELGHLEQLATGDVAAIVTGNLFGMPNDLGHIEGLARQRGIFMLDDAAQALGARLGGRPVGTFGDAGIFSFDKGKNISTIQGGALVAHRGPLFDSILSTCVALPQSQIGDTLMTAAKLLPYALLLRPAGYSLVRQLPLLGLGETRYETRYPMTRLSRGLAGLAVQQLARLPDQQTIRVQNAAALRAELDGIAGLKFITPLPASEPVFPRFPLRVRDPGQRERLLCAFDQAGIGATGLYPRALPDVAQVARLMPPTSHPFPGARTVAQGIVTLPTHAFSPPGLARRVRDVMLAVLSV